MNSASLSRVVLQHFNAAETPIATKAAPKNKTDGSFDVSFSIPFVTLSSFPVVSAIIFIFKFIFELISMEFGLQELKKGGIV